MKSIKKIFIFASILALLFATDVYAADGINASKVTLNVGDSYSLEVGTGKASWVSYNSNVASVDRDGNVTAIKKGATKVRGRVGANAYLCSVTVVDSSIKLNKTAATIYYGGTSINTVQLKATVKGASKNVTWSSDNESIAVVDGKGKVTSVGVGTAVVSASANGKTASCVVTVKDTTIGLNHSQMQLSTRGAGSSIKIRPTITGSKKTVKWETSDKNVVTVSGGKVTGKHEGTAVITATANGVSSSCEVHVVDGISINEEKIVLYANALKPDTRQLKTNAGKKDIVIWDTSDSNIASVSGTGLVTPISEGTATITARMGEKSDTCIVEVKETATDIVEDFVQLKTKGNKSYTISPKVVGKTNSLKWVSSNTKVATVSKGKVTARKAGTATISCTANGITDSMEVEVLDFDPIIKLNQHQYFLYTGKGNTLQLKASVDGASKTVVWSSSDESVAVVTNKGKVTAVGSGSAVITATANGVSGQCIINVKQTEVVFDTDSIFMGIGDKISIGYDVIGVSQSAKVSSTNSKVVSVSKGIITAKSYGEADVKVSANGITALCHVVVGDCSHVFDAGVVKTEPTCGKDGTKTYTCTRCGYSYDETMPATGEHKYEEEIIQHPTCKEGGMMVCKCSVCGDSSFKPLPAEKHQYAWVESKAPTCKDDGVLAYTCSVCGDVAETKTAPALGHSYGEWEIVVEAEVDKPGIRRRTCTVCGYKDEENYELEESDIHVHNFVKHHTEEPSCTTEGYTEYVCECGEVEQRDIVPPVGHKYNVSVVNGTCLSASQEVHECSVCGDFYVVYGEYGPHTPDEWQMNQPSCTKDGSRTKYCQLCHNILETEVVPATGHNYEWVETKPATCTENGLKEYICSNCGDVDDSETILSHHDWQDVVVTKEPAGGAHTKKDDFGKAYQCCNTCGKRIDMDIVNIDLGGGETKTYNGKFWDDDVKDSLYFVNGLREEVGESPLKWADELEDLGRIRAVEIWENLDHARPNGEPRQIVVNGTVVTTGENLQFGDTNMEEAMEALRNSSGHYQNMITSYYKSYYCACYSIYDPEVDESLQVWVQLFTAFDFDTMSYETSSGETEKYEKPKKAVEKTESEESEKSDEVTEEIEDSDTEEEIEGTEASENPEGTENNENPTPESQGSVSENSI